MEVYAVGQVNNGISQSSDDALNVSHAITQTPFFQQTVSNPVQRNEFMKALQLRQEQALANNNKTMFHVFGNMLNAVKTAYSGDVADDLDKGFRAVG